MRNVLSRKLILLMGDAVMIVTALYLSPALQYGYFIDFYIVFDLQDVASLLSYLFFFYIFDLYTVMEQYSRGPFIIRFGVTLVLANIFIASVFFLFRVPPYSVGLFLSNSALIFCFCIGWRILFGKAMDRARQPLRLAVLGAGRAGCALLDMIKGNKDYEVTCFLDDDEKKWGDTMGHVSIIGGSDMLITLVRERRIDKVVVACTSGVRPDVYKKLIEAKFSGVNVYEMPTFVEMTMGKIPVLYVNDPWLTHSAISGVHRSVYTQRMKRILDILLSLFLFTLSLPFMALIWLAIRLDSPGPALFVQTRVGWQGKLFDLVKLRTMHYGAEMDRTHAGCKNDPRITRVGRVLRFLRLDELPQIWNVLRGDMSFIGPRALMVQEVAEFDPAIPYFWLRHSIRPGITGWAQVNYPHGVTKEDALEKLQYDLYYLKNMSFFLDLHILLRTVRVVLFGKGAR